jgi:DNA-binding XRE family transcriptional regulator
MIELPEKEDVRLEFTSEFDAERNQLIPVRMQHFTQQDMAEWLGKSLRTIQHFEKGKNYDPYILTGYRVLAELLDS